MALSQERINQLAVSHEKVKKIAVLNFLGTVASNSDQLTAMMNLSLDTKLYAWNAQTVKAIRIGIQEHFA